MGNYIKKLALGTVQFGLNYGINNFAGQPERAKSLEMLDYAFNRGIKVFDTAYAYGNAEEILGEFLNANHSGGEVKIISKLKPNIIAESQGEAGAVIRANLEDSLKHLKLDYVDGYLFHTPAYVRDEKLMAIMADLKQQGLVKNIGVSVYEEEDALYAAGLPAVDYIQAPYSIFDQRMDRSGFFQLAKKNGKTVFARSAFLQGLFFLKEEKIPPHLNEAKKYLRELDEIIAPYGLSRLEASWLFALKNEQINYVVFGVDNLAQLKEDLSLAESHKDLSRCWRELKSRFANIEKSIIFPSLWKK